MTTTTSSNTSVSHPLPASHPPRFGRAGGIAALVAALTYVVGFVILAAHLGPDGYLDSREDPTEALTFLLEHQSVYYVWNSVAYLLGGVALVVLTLALHERLVRRSPAMSQTATAFGLIWSGLILAAGMVILVGQQAAVDLQATDADGAASLWASVRAIQNGMGGGIELVGGVWALLLGLIGLRTGAFGRRLSVLGIVVGAAGILTVVPLLEPATAVFGLGFIAWFVATGRVLLAQR
ncbi:MAG: DUF4386 family protein [Acidimicrobiales bacterium]|nr:DUF4386 family protein [Acidimicrobiales bacterium]